MGQMVTLPSTQFPNRTRLSNVNKNPTCGRSSHWRYRLGLSCKNPIRRAHCVWYAYKNLEGTCPHRSAPRSAAHPLGIADVTKSANFVESWTESGSIFFGIHAPPAGPISVSQHTDSRLTSRLNCVWSADQGVIH